MGATKRYNSLRNQCFTTLQQQAAHHHVDYRAAATVARELAVLKRLLKVAMEWGKVRTDPTVMVENSQ